MTLGVCTKTWASNTVGRWVEKEGLQSLTSLFSLSLSKLILLECYLHFLTLQFTLLRILTQFPPPNTSPILSWCTSKLPGQSNIDFFPNLLDPEVEFQSYQCSWLPLSYKFFSLEFSNFLVFQLEACNV
jgi:hypothetical protein